MIKSDFKVYVVRFGLKDLASIAHNCLYGPQVVIHYRVLASSFCACVIIASGNINAYTTTTLHK